jgi:cytidylate kinase
VIITLSGKAGAGKSTIARALAKKFRLKRYSIGDLTRQIAKKRHLSIAELAKYEERHSSIDRELDKMQKELGKKKHNFIIDGRISFHFIPQSIKIFLDVEDGTGAARIFRDHRATENGNSVKDVLKMIKQRRASEKKRYARLYHINPYKESNYDLVVNTTGKRIPEVVKQVSAYIKKKKALYIV